MNFAGKFWETNKLFSFEIKARTNNINKFIMIFIMLLGSQHYSGKKQKILIFNVKLLRYMDR